ncbi:Glycosyltransferase involved in cell wall bisynthesis [Catalinimonas alkaloidigena]|uniref:Glycosyltransferase involved in cell wall bisynthesis n=1 Tax=Catalinimonas alkaloidigena TaxID=1075417 RepID=A0A1G8XC78_9BACT|nr:glycosyltransferase family 4 protein [Catalinimonas alkaloidigena]SDJ87390.1 Glycosyltransferase involved in cell wall bisynthesis [Catalinimonas alkaloidigena]
MKIIHFVLGNADPNTMNGVNKSVFNLATYQYARGLDVEVWGAVPLAEKQNTSNPTFPLRLFDTTKLRFKLSKELINALYALPENAFFHFHSVFIPEYYAISLILKEKHIPYALTPRSGYNPVSLKKNPRFKKVYIRFFESRLVEDAELLHAVGPLEEEDLAALFPKQRVLFIPNGQDFNFTLQDKVTFPMKSKPIFGFCGRVSIYQKGLDLMMEGVAQYCKQGGKGDLYFIGDGGDRPEVEKEAQRLGIGDRVHFLGAMYGDAKMTQIQAMDVFMHTSRWEGLSRAILEAASVEVPLLVSRETGMEPYIDQYACGLMLPENTPEAIAKGMLEFDALLETPRYKQMQTAAKQMVEQEFAWDAIIRRVNQEIYGIQA